MSSAELANIDWLGRGGAVCLAFTAATLCVMLLRRPCRRLFGAERAFLLWLLPPLAMLTSQLPHAVAQGEPALPPVLLTVTAMAGAWTAPAQPRLPFDWRAGVLLVWLVGVALSVALAVLVQQRYRLRLRGAVPMTGLSSTWPVLRAASADVGPALVGAWRPRIVLPADFEHRYDVAERALIFAHETMHARRRDGWWCLAAQVAGAVFWFHPLAWLAVAVLRHDQELACDAAVLREHGGQRRRYASAMLKTQSAALSLPVGCPWSRHPLTERIAMLKQQPGFPGRRISGIAMAILIGAVGTGVYAAVPAPAQGVKTAVADRYTLKVDVAFDGKPAAMHFTQCLRAGEYAAFDGTKNGVPEWHGRFAVAAAGPDQIEIRSQLKGSLDKAGGGTEAFSTQPVVRTKPLQRATILVGAHVAQGPGGDKISGAAHYMQVDLTPSAGCDGIAPAAALSTLFFHGMTARQMAQSVAIQSGLVLRNPYVLDDRRAIAGNFEQVPPRDALRLIADVVGMRAEFSGNEVRFQAK